MQGGEVKIKRNGDFFMMSEANSCDVKMVFVKGGKFTMGNGFENWDETLLNSHKVRLSDFWIADLPVTQEFFDFVMNSKGSFGEENKLNVEDLNWNEATRFCKNLNEKMSLLFPGLTNENLPFNNTGKYGFRLPTESEWEYSARGGQKFEGVAKFNYSDSYGVNETAWYDEDFYPEEATSPQRLRSKIGLYDVSGGLSEWCLDKYDENFYVNETVSYKVCKADFRISFFYSLILSSKMVIN